MFPLLSFILVLTLSACGDDKSFPPPDPITDTTPPSIFSYFPDEVTSTDFEVDYEVEIIFSERMNLDSLTTEGGVKFYSGKDDNSEETEGVTAQELSPREAIMAFSEVPVIAEDLITGKEIQIPGTKLTLKHASGRFALNNAYTIQVAEPARDLVEDDLNTSVDERNYMEAVSSIDFITQKGKWKTIRPMPNIQIETAQDGAESATEVTNNRLLPKVISNNNGDTFALWLQEGSIAGINQLWVSRYLPNEKLWTLIDPTKKVCLTTDNTSCANSEKITTNDNTSVIDFQAVVNDSGQIVVAWSQATQAGGFVSIHARLFDGQQWQEVTEISSSGLPNLGDADSPRVVMDKTGNVVAIWREYTGTTTRIKANIFQVEFGVWTEAPVFVDDGSGSATETPELAINENGRAVAVWAQNVNSRLRIFSSRINLNQSTSWQNPIQIDEISPNSVEFGIGHSTKPKVALDNNGDAIAVWLKFDGLRNNVWYNRFAGNWGATALSLEGDRRGDADSPQIIISRDKKALVLWTQRVNSSKTTELKSRLFNALTGWENETIVESSSAIHKHTARFDREGNINLVWQEAQPKGSLSTSYYSKLTETWSQAESLTEQVNANNVSLAPLYEDGRFLSVWESIDGLNKQLEFNIYSD